MTMQLARRPFLAVAVAASGLLAAPRRARAAESPVRGSGVAATQRRDIGAFTGVGLGAPFAVVLRPGSREAIEIVADDNILPLVETSLRDRTLQIELPRHIRIEPRTPIVVTVDYVHLDDLAVGGSGRISAKSMKAARLDAAIGGSGSIDLADLDAGSLAVAIGGSGSLRADGRARKVSVNVAGSGSCDAEHLVAAEVAVNIAGSGSARVHAESALRASIAGSGDLHHGGAATPQVSIIGNGRVRRI
ncbi:MAG TPA: head GIN domain-containing protein [Caldimonas sp.]|jgi:hypothetical protein|nr:head GIN domain-containing protein [Caldimonas sp.]